MSIVIAIAPTPDTANSVWSALQKTGLQAAAPSRREQLTPQQLHALMLKTVQQRQGSTLSISPANDSLDRLWTELAADLVLANVEAPRYGWHQPLDAHTPGFWQRFDPQTRFVLAYENPAEFIARSLAERNRAQENFVWNADIFARLIQHWHETHSLLLDTFYALGSDAVLVHVDQSHQVPRMLDESASEAGTVVVAESLPNQPDLTVLTELLRPLVRQHKPSHALWQELQAAAHAPMAMQADESQNGQHAVVACLELQTALASTRRAFDASLQQQTHLQDQLSAEILARQRETAAKLDLVKQIDALIQAQADLQQELESLRKQHTQQAEQYQGQLREQKEESELLLNQLHQVQEELEKYFLKSGEEAQTRAAAQQELAALKKQQEQVKKAQADLQQELESLRTQNTQQVEQYQGQLREQAEESELLLNQLHQVQEELEKHFLKSGEEAQARAAAQQELEALKKQQEQVKKAQTDLQQELESLRKQHTQQVEQYQGQLREQTEESELLLTQLHQVQEELERYFLQYQDQKKQLHAISQFWRQQPPADLWVDMRRTEDGHGWYEAEADGRWSGPGTESLIELPPLAAGDYLVELHIADAMAPELVAGLQLVAQLSDGQSLPVELVHEFGTAPSLYPMVSAGMLTLSASVQVSWHLQLLLPQVISPAEHGSSDTRQLGLRLQGLRLSLQQSENPETQEPQA